MPQRVLAMLRSSEEFEVLPTAANDTEAEQPRWMKRPAGLHVSPRALRFRRWAMLFWSLLLIACSSVFTTRNLLDSQSAAAGVNSCHLVLDKLWPVGLPNRTDDWENENSKSMRALLSCVSSDTCRENQKDIVLLSTNHFVNAIAGGDAGEDIWAASVLDALRQLDYTVIFTAYDDTAQIAAMYRQFPDLVKVVILEGSNAEQCFGDSRCIKSKDNPLGVPAWKMLSFHFWGGSANPLGSAWTLSPENLALLGFQNSAENIYLGYSIENTCTRIPTTPFSTRSRQAYVLAKTLKYFGKDYSWAEIDLGNPPLEVSFVAGIRFLDNKDTVRLPNGIKDLGWLEKSAFHHHVSESRVLVGIGEPSLSPSPYDALCLGVPFINPIHDWDKDDPKNRTKWATQHGVLQYLDPPYVYNVRKNDEQGFWDALQLAMDTPIDRYIIPHMMMEALKPRVHAIVETDWRGKAERLLETRKTTGEGDLFEL